MTAAVSVDYSHFDISKYQDKEDAVRKADVDGAAPAARSWMSTYVVWPSRLALTTAACIIIYEALVLASMWVRKLRFVMVNYLMYLLLAVNFLLLVSLGIIVLRSKKDVSVSGLIQTAMKKTQAGLGNKKRKGGDDALGPDALDEHLL